MYRRRDARLRGPTDTQPGSSMKASASTCAAASWWAGTSRSREPSSGKGGRGSRVRLGPLGPVDAVAPGEALQLQIAAVVETEAVAVAAGRGLAELLGDQDLAAQRLRRDSRGQDHVLAEVVALLGDHLARMQPHPHTQLLTHAVPVALGEGTLDVDRAVERLAGIREGEHEAVALALHLVAVMTGELLAEDCVVLPQ